MAEKEGNKSIVINGDTIAPGKQKLVSISIARLPTGTLIDIPIYVFNSKRPGPVVLIQAGLHGDEINGIEIVRRMLQQKRFKTTRGCVIAVPILNIFGFIHFSRDVPDGKDVNRSFPGRKTGSLASRIAYHYTTEVLAQVDFVIDLHTGGAQRHNFPQVRYTEGDESSKALAEVFRAPFTFPARLIRGSFRNMAIRMGKPTLVYEAGESMRFDDFAIHEGIQGILNILYHYKMIPKPEPEYIEKYAPVHLVKHRWIRAQNAGMFIPEVVNGSSIEKGEELGIITDTFAKVRKKVKAPFNGYILAINHQAVVNQGDALFHVGQ